MPTCTIIVGTFRTIIESRFSSALSYRGQNSIKIMAHAEAPSQTPNPPALRSQSLRPTYLLLPLLPPRIRPIPRPLHTFRILPFKIITSPFSNFLFPLPLRRTNRPITKVKSPPLIRPRFVHRPFSGFFTMPAFRGLPWLHKELPLIRGIYVGCSGR